MTTGTQKKFAHALCHQLLQRWMRKIKNASMSNSIAPPIGLGLKCLHVDSGKLSRAPQGYAKTAASELSPHYQIKWATQKILATVIALRRTQLMRRRRNRRMKWRAGKKDLQSRDEGDPCFPEGLCQGVMWSKCLHPPSSSRYLPHQGTSIKI